MEHDELCPYNPDDWQGDNPNCADHGFPGCDCPRCQCKFIARVRADERTKAAGRVEAAEICTCDPRWDGFNKGQHRDWCVRMVTLAAIREGGA